MAPRRRKRALGAEDSDDDVDANKTLSRVLDPSKRPRYQEPNSSSQSKRQPVVTKAAAEIRLRPGEDLSAFNQRVEETLRPGIQEALRASASREKAAKRTKGGKETQMQPKEAPLREFEKASQKIDIRQRAMAPPSQADFNFPKLAKAAAAVKEEEKTALGKARAEAKRLEVIARYRALKGKELEARGKVYT